MKSQSAILYALVVITFVTVSCNTTRSIERKDNKALNRVKANVELLNEAGESWRKLNPCYPDTVRIGKEVRVVDSSYGKQAIEELNATIGYLFGLLGQDKKVNIDSLRSVITKEVEKKCKPEKIYIYRTDTLPPDRREEGLLRDEINKKNLEISNLKGQIHEKDKQIAEFEKSKKKTMWQMIIGGALSLIGLGGMAFLYFKKK